MNIAYDRISEDVILLYDAMRAYNQVFYKYAIILFFAFLSLGDCCRFILQRGHENHQACLVF